MTSISALTSLPTAATAVLPAAPSLDTVVGGGKGRSKGGGNFLSKLFSGKTLLFAGLGAAAGAFLPVIPGGPLGGAAIGAALALLL